MSASASPQAYVRLHLQRMAHYRASGEIELHIDTGHCVMIDPPRLPRRADDVVAIASIAITPKQQHILDQLVESLSEAETHAKTGKIYIVVEDGEPADDIEERYRVRLQGDQPKQKAKGYSRQDMRFAAAS